MDTTLKLENREALPERLRVLVEELPRSGWDAHPNFDGLTKFWLDRHLMFRDVLGRLRTGSEGFLDNQRELMAHARETQRYAGFLLNELHGHHHIEDVHYFPALQGLDPRLEDGFELLDGDHHALDGHIHALAEKTNAFLQSVSEGGSRDAAGRLHESLAGFETFLDRHLDDEEDLVVPVILKFAPKL
ncbi:hemerythrin domain-containing protein [Tranquillimonas rosea]|uniref:hemerythrin domain-containing protein n=1 Tax=Tranquillimonas rosea TaxID=641238 RepID=UPI003BA8C036